MLSYYSQNNLKIKIGMAEKPFKQSKFSAHCTNESLTQVLLTHNQTLD
jgi:hypothetical protein